MDPLVWGLIILAVFPLLQIPILIYVTRRLEDDDTEEEVSAPATNSYWLDPSEPQPMASYDGSSRRSSPDPTRVTCPQCGTENERLYTYCRNCVRRLPSVGW